MMGGAGNGTDAVPGSLPGDQFRRQRIAHRGRRALAEQVAGGAAAEETMCKRLRAEWRATTSRLAETARYSRLGWLLCLALLPGVATGCAFIAMLYINGRVQAEQDALRAARAMSQVFEVEVATRLARLETLAASPALAAGDLEGFRRQAGATAHGNGPVVLVDVQGRQLLNTLQPQGARLPRSGAAEALARVLATGKPAVSGLFTGAASGRRHVAVLWPVIRPGRETLVLIQGIPVEYLDARLMRSLPDEGWLAGLLDRDGLLIARSAATERFRGRRTVPDVLAALAVRDEGMLATKTLEGAPVLAAYSRSAETGWTVFVGVHEQAVVADVYANLAPVGGLVGAALLAGTLLAWRLHRGTLRALHGLIEAGWRAERGEPGARAPVHGPREIAQLASQFNRMQEAHERARQALQLAASVFDATTEGILIVGADMRIIEANRAFLAMSGYRREELLGRTPRILQSGRHDAAFYAQMWSALNGCGNWEGQIWDRRHDGSLFAAYLSVSRVDGADGKLSHYVSLFIDITEQRLHQDEIEILAYRDPLTHLPNRRLMHDRLQHAIASTARNGTTLAVCSLDLDGFKAVNDNCGHEAGDEVLMAVAGRLQQVIRANDTVARLGGDEFVLLLADLQHRMEAQEIADRALASIAMPIPLASGASAAVSASIGIAYYPMDALDAAELLRLSDSAMYVAKRRGRNRYVLYGGETV
jgi:diguanylate cyclase (GGDEF)-like protein/PAS domain S-box-containing protein